MVRKVRTAACGSSVRQANEQVAASVRGQSIGRKEGERERLGCAQFILCATFIYINCAEN